MAVLKFAATSSFVAVLAVAALGGLNLYTYHRFTHETPVASIMFKEVDGQRYDAEFTPVDGPPRIYRLEGDEWQLDVRMIKWTDWLTFLGEDPLYRLDRLSGRFLDIEEARKVARFTAHALSEDVLVDFWDLARANGEWLPGVDAAYGSGVFLPMADGMQYQIAITRSGLIARAEDR